MSLVCPKLECPSCVWNPFYDVCVDIVECVQKRCIQYALCVLGWADMHDLPPYEDRCALLHSDTLAKRRSIAFVMLIFAVLSERVNSPNLLSVLDLITPQYPTHGTEFLRFNFHRTNYGLHEPMSGATDSLMRSLVFLIRTVDSFNSHFSKDFNIFYCVVFFKSF
jgi:hypothetical protein